MTTELEPPQPVTKKPKRAYRRRIPQPRVVEPPPPEPAAPPEPPISEVKTYYELGRALFEAEKPGWDFGTLTAEEQTGFVNRALAARGERIFSAPKPKDLHPSALKALKPHAS